MAGCDRRKNALRCASRLNKRSGAAQSGGRVAAKQDGRGAAGQDDQGSWSKTLETGKTIRLTHYASCGG